MLEEHGLVCVSSLVMPLAIYTKTFPIESETVPHVSDAVQGVQLPDNKLKKLQSKTLLRKLLRLLAKEFDNSY